jgi:hypothetical protein
LGTGWSGQISCTRSAVTSRHNELQDGSSSSSTHIVVDVQNGVATVNGHAEVQSWLISRRGIFGRGLVFDYGHDEKGAIAGTATGQVTVNLDPATGRYQAAVNYSALPEGVRQTTSCQRDRCDNTEFPLPIAACFGYGPAGQTDDPNRLTGTLDLAQSPLGTTPPGVVWTVKWDLARQGATR